MVLIQKKICMIGDFSVGKTSLVMRFVKQVFSDKYLTTLGVKVDTKLIELDADRRVKLVLWDIAGNNTLAATAVSYLRGAAGFLLVVDGTRQPTWDSAVRLQEMISMQIGAQPFIVLLNKADLQDEWELDMTAIDAKRQAGWSIMTSSAKTGENVEAAFQQLARRMVDN